MARTARSILVRGKGGLSRLMVSAVGFSGMTSFGGLVGIVVFGGFFFRDMLRLKERQFNVGEYTI